MVTLRASPDRGFRAGVFTDVYAARKAIEAARQAGLTEVEVVADEKLARHFHDIPKPRTPAEKGRRGVLIGAAVGFVAALGLRQWWVAIGSEQYAGLFGLILLAILSIWGAFIGAMVSRGFTREPENYFDQELEPGQILVAIRASEPSRLADASRILAEAGSRPIALPTG